MNIKSYSKHPWQESVESLFSRKGLPLHRDAIELLYLLEPKSFTYKADGKSKQNHRAERGYVWLGRDGNSALLEATRAERIGNRWLYTLSITRINSMKTRWIYVAHRDVRTPEGGGLMYAMFSNSPLYQNNF